MKEVMIVILTLTGSALAQQRRECRSSIVYIAGATVYIDAGRLKDVSAGDTATIYRGNTGIGSVCITAIADSSSAARIISQATAFSIGNTAVVMVSVPKKGREAFVPTETVQPQETEASISRPIKRPGENVISGMVALQYNLIAAEDSRLNLSQPGAVVQLNVDNLLGAGMSLSFYGISFLDQNGNYALYGSRSGLQNNIYQFSLAGELPGASFGYGIGRLTSPYVSGLGAFDGAQVYYRYSDLTFGVLGGAAPNIPASTLDFSGTKSAAFVNYHSGKDAFHQYDGTVAYGLRMVNGNLDRNFLYLQNSLSLGTDLSFYETSEVDLSKLSGGTPKPGFDFSNTFFSMNYYPARWLFANLGYDAYRTVYLFQTMKSLPDSLIDRNILQGFRAGLTAYLPASITLSAYATYRTRQDYIRDEHTISGSVRAADIFDLGIGGSVRYMNMVGVYSNANNVMLELDRTFFDDLDLTLSFESYNVSVAMLQQTYTTRTISGYFDYSFSPKWFSTLGLDDIIDATMNSFQVYAEIGFRF